MTQKEIHSIEASPNGFKKYLPHLVVLGIFLVIAAFFCSPWLQGQKLLPHDVEQWLKMSKETRDYRDATGETSFWMNNDFAGMPSALTDPYSENNWFSKIKNATIFYKHGENMNPILLFFWAMVGGFFTGLVLKDQTLAGRHRGRGLCFFYLQSYHYCCRPYDQDARYRLCTWDPCGNGTCI
ncbi:MAG: hypothetical protein KL787_09235 [Taibaiella sp.]|nr:hypothetical protein [Taibaiella sp.]